MDTVPDDTMATMTTALVTGATAGIGWSFCRRLADDGHDLVLVARDAERLEQRATELRDRSGVQVEVLPADLSDRAQVQRVADRLASADRPVDLLVNNAGFGIRTPFTRSDVADEERMVDVLVGAVLVLSHAAANAMRERGHGAIVNVSSVAGFAAMGSYSASKAWVTTFTEALATELAGSGVRVQAPVPRLHPHRVPPARRDEDDGHARPRLARRRRAGGHLAARPAPRPGRQHPVGALQGGQRRAPARAEAAGATRVERGRRAAPRLSARRSRRSSSGAISTSVIFATVEPGRYHAG